MMYTRTTISLPSRNVEEFKPKARILGEGPGQSTFVTLDLGDDVTVYLPGYGAECRDAARELARVLLDAANALDLQLKVASVVEGQPEGQPTPVGQPEEPGSQPDHGVFVVDLPPFPPVVKDENNF